MPSFRDLHTSAVWQLYKLSGHRWAAMEWCNEQIVVQVWSSLHDDQRPKSLAQFIVHHQTKTSRYTQHSHNRPSYGISVIRRTDVTALRCLCRWCINGLSISRGFYSYRFRFRFRLVQKRSLTWSSESSQLLCEVLWGGYRSVYRDWMCSRSSCQRLYCWSHSPTRAR